MGYQNDKLDKAENLGPRANFSGKKVGAKSGKSGKTSMRVLYQLPFRDKRVLALNIANQTQGLRVALVLVKNGNYAKN